MPNDYKTLMPEYATLWDSMAIVRDTSLIEKTIKRIIAQKVAYLAVETAIGVPWYVVGIIDMREGGGGCRTHLHNGDPLKCRTVNVPANRPTTGSGPFTWSESAIDALRMKKYDKITEWTIEQMAWCFERYNGFGYRQPSINIPTPYLWGGTNHQAPGKYIRDHVFSKTVMDPQIGCMALLKGIAELESIELVSAGGATADPSETSPASNRKADKKPIGKVIAETVKENKEVIVLGTTVLGGAGAKVASDATPPPKVDVSRGLEKAQQTRVQVEQAKDLGLWAKTSLSGDGAWLFGIIGIFAIGLIGYQTFGRKA